MGKGIVDMASHFETVQTQLSTVLQDTQKGKELFEDLRKFSFETTFGVDELASASTMLLNVGESTRNLKQDLKMLGDLAGGDKNKFAELSNIYSKVLSQGKATAIQLQQINLRGIPISQKLKEMGVTGTASADQLTEAFRKLTSEGGQFNDAMDKINDTIEGKRGFISDTYKEMLVNLGDATGITQAYKDSLDVIYNKLQKFTDWLAEVNESPVKKALLQGAMVTALVGLGAVIVGTIVPALTTVIAKLGIIATLKTIINPTTAIAGLAIAGIVAGISYMTDQTENFKSEIEDATESIKEQISEYEKLLEMQRSDRDKYTSADRVDTEVKLLEEKLKLAKEELSVLEKQNEEKMKEWELYQKTVEENGYEDFVIGEGQYFGEKSIIDMKNKQQEVAELQKQIEQIKGTVLYTLSEAELKQRNYLDDTISKLETDYKNAQNGIAEKWQEMDEAKAQNLDDEIAKYMELKEFYERGITGATVVTSGSGAKVLQYERMDNTVQVEGLDKINKILTKLEKNQLENKKKAMKESYENNATDYQTWVLSQMGVNIDNEIKKAMKEGGVSQYFDKEGVFKTNSVGTETLLSNAMVNSWDKYKGRADVGMADKLGITQAQTILNQRDELEKTIKNLVAYADVATEDDKQGRWKKGELMVNQEVLKKYLNKLTELEGNYYKQQIEDVKTLKSKNDAYIKEQIENEISLRDIVLYRQQLEAGLSKENLKEYKEQMKQLEALNELKNPENYMSMSSYADMLKKQGGAKTLGGYALSTIDSVAGSSDYGTFTNSLMSSGSVWTATLATLFNSLASVIGGIKGVDKVLSPIKELLKELAPLIKTFMLLFMVVMKGFVKLAEWIMKGLDWITGGLFSALASSWDEVIQAQETESDTLAKLNEQYESLLSAMKEQEEYYLGMKKEINSDSYKEKVYGVNDMILTPNGTFSTHPEDTIMAMKHPEDLMGGGSVVMIQPIINNNVSDVADVKIEQRQNAEGQMEMLVTISKKIANDVARGVNGWDSAFASRDSRLQGLSRLS